MTMNYRRKNKRNYKKIVSFSVGIILVILILSIFSKSVRTGLTDIANAVAYPFWKSKVYVGSKFYTFKGLIKSRESLVETNIELREELLRRKARSFDLELLEAENENFRAMLERADATSTLPAFILARPPKTGYDVFVVDRGGNAGVTVGHQVFFENILLGEVIEISPETSKVKLLSSGGTETQASLGSQNLSITMMGRGG